MLEAFKKHINKHFPTLSEKKLLIAISGGVDSVVLTTLLHKLGYTIALAHCNFQLRGKESDLDETFVENLAEKLDIKLFKIRFDTKVYAQKHKLSTQISARELRYNWFEELIKTHHFNHLITAHHADDNLETFLINLSRGTGLEGLTGIPERNGNILRPLLNFSRQEILDYAHTNHILWREDQSNSETKYLRNKIRHNIVPQLKELNPKFLDNFLKTVRYLSDSQDIINDKTSELTSEISQTSDNITEIHIEQLLKLSNPKAYLFQILKSYNVTQYDDIFDLLSAQSGKKIITNTHIILKNRESLLISPRVPEQNSHYLIEENQRSIDLPIPLKFNDSILSKTYIEINQHKITYPLILRKWEQGDIIYPTGMTGKKKLSKYFKDEKLSQFDKEKVWLLCNNTNEIIWVIGMRQDRRFLASEDKSKLIINLIN